ncbi:universal stress protein [Kitasatospora sp. NBC_01560]|uniref:universal stress protein n=1 Tax=Kitasatospora sp. NBC_01560 TaxID=2975965 RepID=UPI00386D3DF2
MNGPIVAGFDGSAESITATEWAAHEAVLRRLPLELVRVGPRDGTGGPGTSDARDGYLLITREAELRALAPGAEVTSIQVPEDPAAVLAAAGRDATMLVLGSRGLGALRGYLVGSVSQEVLRRATCPVVLVRAEGPAHGTADGPGAGNAGSATADGGTDPGTGTGTGTGREVVVGLDLEKPCAAVVAFAFRAAAARSAPLRAVRAWDPPTDSALMAFAAIGNTDEDLAAAARRELADAWRPWQEHYPGVAATAELILGSAAAVLVGTADRAALVVVGRRAHRSPFGGHLGPVAHAAIHHIRCPVAVVPHP